MVINLPADVPAPNVALPSTGTITTAKSDIVHSECTLSLMISVKMFHRSYSFFIKMAHQFSCRGLRYMFHHNVVMIANHCLSSL